MSAAIIELDDTITMHVRLIALVPDECFWLATLVEDSCANFADLRYCTPKEIISRLCLLVRSYVGDGYLSRYEIIDLEKFAAAVLDTEVLDDALAGIIYFHFGPLNV